MKKDTWILVANSSHAKIFRVEKNKDLLIVGVLEHPESRLLESDLVTTKPGRSFESSGVSRHAYEQHISPKIHEFETFARQISDHLDAAREKGHFGKLYLVANPSFLGILRPVLSGPTESLVSGEIAKDMTQMKAEIIRDHLPPIL